MGHLMVVKAVADATQGWMPRDDYGPTVPAPKPETETPKTTETNSFKMPETPKCSEGWTPEYYYESGFTHRNKEGDVTTVKEGYYPKCYPVKGWLSAILDILKGK